MAKLRPAPRFCVSCRRVLFNNAARLLLMPAFMNSGFRALDYSCAGVFFRFDFSELRIAFVPVSHSVFVVLHGLRSLSSLDPINI